MIALELRERQVIALELREPAGRWTQAWTGRAGMSPTHYEACTHSPSLNACTTEPGGAGLSK